MQTYLDRAVREAASSISTISVLVRLWSPPIVWDVTPLLPTGQDAIRIVVGNTALNYMAGHKLPRLQTPEPPLRRTLPGADMDKIQVLRRV
jgi:hypothetical protein